MADDEASAAGARDTATGARAPQVQVRARRINGWTKARRAMFLDQLAATCNVQRSAAAAGIAAVHCYALKRHDPEFAALWTAALEAGYDHIETQLLARAIGQCPDLDDALGDPVERGGREAAPDFDPALAIKLLAQRETRRSTRPRGPVGKRVPIEHVRAVLLVKLAALRKRLEREHAAALPALTAPDCATEDGAPRT